MIFSLSKIIGIHSIHGIHMTTYSEKPLRIVGLTVLLSIDEHIVPFCPQKVYKKYTSSIHQGRAGAFHEHGASILILFSILV